jgi:hypothetical protein
MQSYFGDLWEFAEKIRAARNSPDVTDHSDDRVKELFADDTGYRIISNGSEGVTLEANQRSLSDAPRLSIRLHFVLA